VAVTVLVEVLVGVCDGRGVEFGVFVAVVVLVGV
jgi:hypothetical protein